MKFKIIIYIFMSVGFVEYQGPGGKIMEYQLIQIFISKFLDVLGDVYCRKKES